ncbi:methylase involved in ubiquinone/menaquinone biosynthesis [Hoeflea sp. IMCC20628]|uniref:class I SAM-dependent methyltransferase n=1 Tax=Hoeflea sp. IMCC20628 TaxID=1620421 RepID=UPI00063B0809|nr:methyltransferase domain-containing protein [Hoeflea sp. IMCC20628]AKI00067.1 methylase involved in ubiquinone/menaquinone biosynthesis [Hoeflea sp. IMCC20628]
MSSVSANASVMDGIYRHQRHIYDLTRRYYLLGRNDLIAALKPPTGGTVLEIGCGTARNLILTAKRYPDARVYGLDISAEMLKSAEAMVSKRAMSDRVHLTQGDATRFDSGKLFGVSGFDRVFLSYSLSMIPGWEAALEQAMQAVASGGELHVVDFGQHSALPDWFGKALKAWLARFHVTPRQQIEGVMTALAGDSHGQLTFSSIYRDYARIGVIRLP